MPLTELGAINFYDQEAHKPAGSVLAWLRRVDANGTVVDLGEVAGIKVNNVGSGYTGITVGFTGGAGSAAAATAHVNADGRLSWCEMTNCGSSYTSSPTVSLTPTVAGTGATATAYYSDGFHLAPGRMSSVFEAGQKETPVIGEDKMVFDTVKEEASGIFTLNSLQMDYWTVNFFAKEAASYHWQIFVHYGISRGTVFHRYRLIAIVKFPEYLNENKPADSLEFTGIIKKNTSAITVTEAQLPVANLDRQYDIAANKMFKDGEEIVAPSV